MFVPAIPSGSGPYVLSLIGGIGGSLTLLSYSYLLREEAGPDKGRIIKRQVWEDMLQVMERLALPISEKQRGFFR